MKVQPITMTSSTQVSAVAHSEAQNKFTSMVTMQAPVLDDVQRAPIDLILVVDRSGSMAGRMDLVIQTIEFCISQLREKDGLAIVDYDDRVTTLLTLTKMDAIGRKTAVAQAKRLTPRGCTNLSGGLFKGMQLAGTRDAATKNEIASVLLFTDGMANAGITCQNTIVQLMKNEGWKEANIESSSSRGLYSTPQRAMNTPPRPASAQSSMAMKKVKKSSSFFGSLFGSSPSPPPQQQAQQQAPPPPISSSIFQAPPQQQQQQVPPPPYSTTGEAMEDEVTIKEVDKKETSETEKIDFTVNTFGFGADHNENLLKAIADAGEGSYFFIENKENIPDAFIDCVGGLLSVVAQQIHLTLTASEGVEITDVLTSFPKERCSDGKKFVITIKDLQSEESKDFLIVHKLPVLPEATLSQVLLTANIQYDNLSVTPFVRSEGEIQISLPRPVADAPEVKHAEINKTLDIQMNRWRVAEALEEATTLADKGDMLKARRRLEETCTEVRSTVSGTISENLLGAIKKASKDMESAEHYRSYGAKAAKCSAMSYQQQRFNAVSCAPSAMDGMASPFMENKKKKMMKASFLNFKSS